MKAKLSLALLLVIFLIGFVSAEDVSQNSLEEKDLVAKGFNLKNVEQGVQILIDYEEKGVGNNDDYITEIFFNGEMASRERRSSLELNGPGMNFWKMLKYKLTFSDLVVTAKMDYVTQEGEVSSNNACSVDIDCAKSRSRGLELCVKDHCTSIREMDNSIKEINEDNNCIQQKFKINLFGRQLVPVSTATLC